MDKSSAAPDYGTSRNRRPTVSYAEFERTASALLAKGVKPGLDNVRKSIGGSPETIRQMLRRYWIELYARSQGPAEALTRLPSEIADLAEELWQRSMALAAQRASHDDNAARERLEQVKRENEVRSHALTVKERTLREREESRDKTMTELQEQVRTLVTIVSRNTETIGALQLLKEEAEARAQEYRRRLGQVIARAVAKNQKPAVHRKSRRPTVAKVRARRKSKKPARASTRRAKRGKKQTKR